MYILNYIVLNFTVNIASGGDYIAGSSSMNSFGSRLWLRFALKSKKKSIKQT